MAARAGTEPATCTLSDVLLYHWATGLWRPEWDSNPQHPPWQGGALTNCAIRPYLKKCWTSLVYLLGLGHLINTHFSNGCSDRTRTCDKAINSRRLYQLSYRAILVGRAGIEPATPRFSVLCSTNWAICPWWCVLVTIQASLRRRIYSPDPVLRGIPHQNC